MNRHRVIPATLTAGALLLLVAGVLAGRALGQTGDRPFRIVSPDWLALRTGDANVKILDVRTSVAEYQFGHVPNAIFLANDTLRAPKHGVPVQYLDPEEMAALFQRAGINHGDLVVVYADGKEVLGATMVAYALHRIGHDRVAILDGGLQAYRSLHPLMQAYPKVMTGSLSPTLDETIFVTLSDLKDLMMKPEVRILDTRPAGDYRGQTKRWIRNGHIPGAINLDWRQLMQENNLHAFKSVDEMKRLIEATGVRKTDDVIVYCGTSREATLVYHVMKNVLGYPNVRLYEGSWTEYCARLDLPIARKGVVIDGSTLREDPSRVQALDQSTKEALVMALQDERRARAYYKAVMERFGERRPFSNIVDAEERHEAFLLALFDRFGLKAPPDEWADKAIELPSTFSEAVGLAVKYEKQNVAMYDEFLTFVTEPDIRSTMTLLRDASRDRHLPALSRWDGN